MADVKNAWIGFLDRSFETIKASLLSRVTNSNPEMTDHSESNPFVIIISMFAGIAEMLGLYIDNAAEESFMGTATRRTSVVKHTNILDYRIKARSSEKVDLSLTWSIPVPSAFTINAGSFIDSEDGIRFLTTSDIVIPINDTISVIPMEQVVEVTNVALGTTDGTLNQRFSLGAKYTEDSIQLTVDVDPYTEVKSFSNYGANDKVFIVDLDIDSNMYIILGDGINGELPSAALTLSVIYQETDGPGGKVGAGLFDEDTLSLDAVLPGALEVSLINSQENSSSGALYQSTESIRKNGPLSIKTLSRMVTYDDHIQVMEDLVGVQRSEVNFDCGKDIPIYIAPTGGGLASGSLIAIAQAEAELKKMVTTFPTVLASGETKVVIGATVTALARKAITETKTQVETALVEFGNIDNQKINGSIRLSDLQALIDNQTNVDFVTLTSLYTKPYARPTQGTNVLTWTNETFATSVNKTSWKLEYILATDKVRVFREGAFKGEVDVGATYVAIDGIVEFTVQAGGYADGDAWEFTTQPYLGALILTDFSLFTIDVADLFITVLSQPTSSQSV